jgi:hypothetical protein
MSREYVKVTPEQRAAVVEWYRQKQAIGTMKHAARRFNVKAKSVQAIILRCRRIAK